MSVRHCKGGRSVDEYPKEFLDLLASVKAKRPRTVIEHILKNGHVTSRELKDLYGYHHPPRAIRDVAVKTVSILFSGDETEDYYRLLKLSGGEPLQATIKKILRDYLK